MKKSVLKTWVLAGILAIVYAAVILAVWTVQTRMASGRLNYLMEPAIASAVDVMDWALEPEALRIARIVVDKWGSVEAASKAVLGEVREFLDCDQINIVGTNNVVVASSDPTLVGYDMTSVPETDEFTAINRGEASYLTQGFRRGWGGLSGSVPRCGTWSKYVAQAFPGGGYVEVGETYRDFRRRYTLLLKSMFMDEPVGENGYYLLVDRDRGTIVSGYKAKEWAGTPLADSGIDPAQFGDKDDGVARTVRVFGVESYVRRVRIAFVELDAYVVIPTSDILSDRNTAVSATAVVVGIVFLVGGLLFCKVVRQHERIEDLFAREVLRLEKDLQLARAIQTNSLPSQFPPYPNLADRFDIFARMLTAKEVGGDFYDFFFVAPGKLALVIADVSGKGVPAALFMMRAKATVQGLVKGGAGLAEAVAAANARLAEDNDANMFVTMWIGIVDIATGELEYVNAGHNPPLLQRADGSVEYLTAMSGPALAVIDCGGYARQTLTLRPGDGVVLYTDGVTEATDAAKGMYGEDRLVRTALGLNGARDAGALIDGIVKDVNSFADGAEQADDITILAFKLCRCRGQRQTPANN